MTLLIIAILYVLSVLSAARWWMRTAMLWFDFKFELKPCQESDFFFFCWTWPIVCVLMLAYWFWTWGSRPFTWLTRRAVEFTFKKI